MALPIEKIGKAEDATTKDDGNEVQIQHMEHSGMSPVIRMDSYLDDTHINLSWRSWMVVLFVLFCPLFM